MKLCISLATRGRPQQLVDTVKKSICNLTDPNTTFLVIMDSDDEGTFNQFNWEMANGNLKPAAGELRYAILPRADTIAEKWNQALNIPADLYLVAADDDPYITPGYDSKLLDAAGRFPDGIGMVYGHMANASFSGVVAPTRRFCELTGGIFPTYFPYWWVDHWTDDLARMIGRISMADVRTDQSRAGKTQEMREPGWWATWFDAAMGMRRVQAQKLIYAMDEPDWRREILMSAWPLIESRSRWVNDNVRQNARAYEGWSGLTPADERYQRVKQRAVDMVPDMLLGMPAEREAGVLGAWGADAYRYALTPPTTAPALVRAYG